MLATLIWGAISAFHLLRYVLRRNPLSVFTAINTMGWVVLGSVLVDIIPRWATAPILIATTFVGFLEIIFIVDSIKREGLPMRPSNSRKKKPD